MIQPSGYAPCACRDCFELTLSPGTMCHSCDDAGCNPRRECLAAGAYGGEPEVESAPATDVDALLAELDAVAAPAAREAIAAQLATIPDAAYLDGGHPYWSTPEAVEVLAALVLAIDSAAVPR